MMQDKLKQYEQLLIEWQNKFNLVAPSTLADIDMRHFQDSAQLADILPRQRHGDAPTKIIDLGSGGGFPGVVLAIMGFDVTAIESIGKKAGFLTELKNKLNLTNLTVVNDRVENYVKALDKSRTHIFTARAFAPLVKIMDYVAPIKSRLFLLKGREIETEILTAKTKYNFDYTLYPSKTGDGFMVIIENIRRKKQSLFHIK